VQHANRYDLPKGHNEVGETETQTALRELHEESGIKEDQVIVHPEFQFKEVYYPKYKRFGGQTVEKTIVIYSGILKDSNSNIALTEHKGFQWLPWKPPHSIQRNTIDPLLAAVAKFGVEKITGGQ